MNITGNPVTFGKKDYKKNMITQMTQPVKRKYDVLLERYASGSNSVLQVKLRFIMIKKFSNLYKSLTTKK